MNRKESNTMPHRIYLKRAIAYSNLWTANECHVLIQIVDHIHSKTGESRPSLKELSWLTRLSTRTIIRCIQTLVASDVLTVKRKHNMVNTYVVNWARLMDLGMYGKAILDKKMAKLAGTFDGTQVCKSPHDVFALLHEIYEDHEGFKPHRANQDLIRLAVHVGLYQAGTPERLGNAIRWVTNNHEDLIREAGLTARPLGVELVIRIPEWYEMFKESTPNEQLADEENEEVRFE